MFWLNQRPQRWREDFNELALFPGRLEGSLRDSIIVSLTVVAAMTLRVAGLELSVALFFLIMRESPGLTLNAAIEMFASAVLALAFTTLLVQISDGSEVVRFFAVLIVIFVSALCAVSTTMPLFWIIAGFYGFINISAWDTRQDAREILASSLYHLASLGLMIVCAVGVEYSIGLRNPGAVLATEMKNRLEVLSRFFRLLGSGATLLSTGELRRLHARLIRYANAGDYSLNELYDRLRTVSNDAELPLGIHYRIGLVGRVIEKSVAVGFGVLAGKRLSDGPGCVAIAERCEGLISPDQLIDVPEGHHFIDERLEEINDELDQFAGTLGSEGSKQESFRVTRRWGSVLRSLVPRGMPTSGNVLHSLKVTLAASICYILANAIDWPGILTCVVTVLVTGLTSTGPMKMKQAHRFIGSLIGGGIGVGVLSLLYPNMDSITALVCVVAPLAFVAGWITRSPTIGYIGYQIALSFFLTALPGMSASTDVTPAGNRLVGIILGFAVMWFVFDQMWPVRTTDALTESLRRIRDACDEVKTIALSPERPGLMDGFEELRSMVSVEVFNVRQMEISVKYETGRHKMHELFGVKRLVREIESAAADFYTTALQVSRNRTS